jgi:hypothetical protein
MAKIFIVLLSVLVVLNGMTFLVVVNQTSSPAQGVSSREADAAGKKPGADLTIQKLDNLERVVQGVKGSMDRLSSKVDGLQSKVNQVASRPAAAPAVTQPLPAPGSNRISPVRRGPVDYSRITTPQASGAQESGNTPAASAEEGTDEEGQAPADGSAQPAPAPQPVEGAAEGTEEGSGQAQPAAESTNGAAPGAAAQGETETP